MDAFAAWGAVPWAALPADDVQAEAASRPVRVRGDEPVAVVLLLDLETVALEG